MRESWEMRGLTGKITQSGTASNAASNPYSVYPFFSRDLGTGVLFLRQIINAIVSSASLWESEVLRVSARDQNVSFSRLPTRGSGLEQFFSEGQQGVNRKRGKYRQILRRRCIVVYTELLESVHGAARTEGEEEPHKRKKLTEKRQ